MIKLLTVICTRNFPIPYRMQRNSRMLVKQRYMFPKQRKLENKLYRRCRYFSFKQLPSNSYQVKVRK